MNLSKQPADGVKTAKSPAMIDWKSLLVFIFFALLCLSIVLFKKRVDTYQQFYIRVLIGLAAAGIAVIIPGFFEIRLRWLSNSIRATGAIGIFVLVYTRNPPSIATYETLESLKGDWYYDVHPSGTILGFGAQHYGGIAHFQTEKNEFGENLSITGSLTWKIVDSAFKNYPPFATWQSVSGSVTASNKLIYQYETTDEGKSVKGFCNYTIVRDNDNEIIRLEGNYYRVDSPYVKGTIFIRRDKPFDDRIPKIIE